MSRFVSLAALGLLGLGCQRRPRSPKLPSASDKVVEEGVPLSQVPVPKPVSVQPQAPVLIPRPKEVRFESLAGFTLTPDTLIVLPSGLRPEEQRAVRALQEGLARRLGKPLRLASAPGTSQAICLERADSQTPEKPEGYTLTVQPESIRVTGRDARGLFWGVQTLLQLLGKNTKSTTLPRVAIRDWPTLSLRAVHLFHGNRALPFHQKLIQRILTPLKLNALFLEVEQVRWDADPSVAPPWAGTRAQLKEELAFARERSITVYPLLQSLGHMGWLLGKGNNARFAEDPATPYALCLNDPAAVKYLERFVAEADALFQAPAFHVGLDEVAMRGRFPYRSRPTAAPELFLKGVRHWHDFFAVRGKPISVWADMALHAPEVNPAFGTAPRATDAAQIRAGIPKDVILADWQYGTHDEFPSLRQLKNAGFQKLIAASWYRPKNIQTLSRAAVQVGAQGLIQTTWCGYESREDVLKTQEKRQFTAMVLAAEYFWNGGGPAPEELPFSPEAVFDQYWSA
jgi:hexosaminidase